MIRPQPRNIRVPLVCLLTLALVASTPPGTGVLRMEAAPAAQTTPVVAAFGSLPLLFEPNQGQWEAPVRYVARSSEYTVFLTPEEAVFRLGSPKHPQQSILRMRFVGQRTPELSGLEPVGTRRSYLRGSRKTDWQTGISSVRRVVAKGIYPGIDAVFYGTEGLLEYDMHVQPGYSPNQIEIEFEGSTGVEVRDGHLQIETPAGPIHQPAPVVFQEIDGRRTLVEATFEKRSLNRVGFRIGAYDPARELVVDPVMVYSSYLGGVSTALTKSDQVFGVAVDGEGNAYVTGIADAQDFPTRGGLQNSKKGGFDAFVTKINAAGNAIVYSTYIGGSANDEGHSIAVDSTGAAYITGFTLSSDFPTRNPIQERRSAGQDTYVLKLNPAGDGLEYSTYLGGSDDDRSFSIAVDRDGNAYIAGFTESQNFPTVNSIQSFGGGLTDAFVTKVSADGRRLVYSTFVGGRGFDQAYGVAVDPDGAAYVGGFTTSSNFPTVNARQGTFGAGTDDGFLFKLSADGRSLVYSTYHGGGGSDNIVRVGVGTDGSAYVTGYTASPDFPTINAVQPDVAGSFDAFVSKFSPDGRTLAYSTCWGGSLGVESGAGIAVDSDGSVWVAGYTSSFDLPAVNALQVFSNIDRDAFVMKVAPEGRSILMSSYLGGFGNDNAVGVALDSAGNVFVAGTTRSGEFPLANPFQEEHSASFNGSSDGFITKIRADDIRDNFDYAVPNLGGVVYTTGGNYGQSFFGYGIATAAAGSAVPRGMEIIGLQQSGALVTEVGIQASSMYTAGRFFDEETSAVRGVVTFFNPNEEAATINFEFTDNAGETRGGGQVTVGPRAWLSSFLNTAPYGAPTSFLGTMTFFSDQPVAATAFRLQTNERSEALLSSIAIADLLRPNEGPQVVPHIADGEGFTTTILAVNPTDDTISGVVRLRTPGDATSSGKPLEVTLNDGSRGSEFGYEIKPRSVAVFITAGNRITTDPATGIQETTEKELEFGWIETIPDAGFNAPATSVLISSKQQGNVTASQAVVQGVPNGQAFRFYIESVGDFENGASGSIRTGVAVANRWPFRVTARLDLSSLDGTVRKSAALDIPATGQVFRYLNDIPEFRDLPNGFRGVLRVSTPLREGLSATAIRGRYNERRNYIFTTVGPVNENAGTATELILPHVAEGGGYSTQFIILGDDRGGTFSGNVGLFFENGQPFNVSLSRK